MDELESSSKAKPEEMLGDEQREDLDKEPSLVIRESENTQLAYRTDFKQFIKSHPGIIHTFIDIEDEIVANPEVKVGTTVNKNGIYAEILYQYEFGDNLYNFYKISIDDESYFLKADKRNVRHNVFEEIIDSDKAARRLKAYPIPGVRTADFQLGFKKGTAMYFVAKWLEGQRVDLLFDDLTDKRYGKSSWVLPPSREYEKETRTEEEIEVDKAKMQALQKRIEEVRRLFPTYYDVSPNNFLYNEANDELVWIDMNDSMTRRVKKTEAYQENLEVVRKKVASKPEGTEINILNIRGEDCPHPITQDTLPVYLDVLLEEGSVRRVKKSGFGVTYYNYEKAI